MTRKIFLLWLRKSSASLVSTLVFNLFAFYIVRPVLRWLFPPLTGWERVQGFFGANMRWTYGDLMPYVSTGLWITANAFLFAWMNRDYQDLKKGANRVR